MLRGRVGQASLKFVGRHIFWLGAAEANVFGLPG